MDAVKWSTADLLKRNPLRHITLSRISMPRGMLNKFEILKIPGATADGRVIKRKENFGKKLLLISSLQQNTNLKAGFFLSTTTTNKLSLNVVDDKSKTWQDHKVAQPAECMMFVLTLGIKKTITLCV